MKLALFIAYIIVLGTGYWLKYLNLSHLRKYGHQVPPEFEGSIDPALLRKVSDYTFETSRLGTAVSIVNNALLVVFVFGGLIGVYDRWIASLADSFIIGGLAFILLLFLAETVLDIPFSLYSTFKIENKYGFNTMTFRLWVTDLLKSTAISLILTTAAVSAALFIVNASPDRWWLWVWGFFLLFSIFLMYISPYVIEPLFFKFEPVRAEGLEDRIRAVMEKAGLKVSRVFQVDASRRSRHSNAYFTGIGRVKRIVLFDTLIAQMSHDEITAVLAHEAGHWKKRHVLKMIALTESLALAGILIAFHLLKWEGLPGVIGLEHASFYLKAVIVGFMGSLAMFPFTPLFSFLSRRHEREADRFASGITGRPEAMASALVKLSRENLSNIHPHPLYAKFYYSHPPVVERIRSLRIGN